MHFFVESKLFSLAASNVKARVLFQMTGQVIGKRPILNRLVRLEGSMPVFATEALSNNVNQLQFSTTL